MEESYMKSPWKPVEAAPGETLTSLILNKAQQHGDKVAFVDSRSGESLTYAGFVDAVRNTSTGLLKHGVTKGNTLLVMLPNSFHFPVIFHSILKIGAVASTCIPRVKKDEFLRQYRLSKARFLVTSSDLAGELLRVLEEEESQNKPQVTFVLGEERPGCVSVLSLMTSPATCWPDVHLSPHDLACLLFSSGTTGLPKGVCHTQTSLLYATLSSMSPEVGYYQADDVVLDYVSICHSLGMSSFVLVAIATGTKVIIMEWNELSDFLQTIQKYKVTKVIGTPAVVVQLVKEPLVQQYDISSLRSFISAGSPLTETLLYQAKAMYPHINIRDLFGMSEAGSVALMSEHAEKPGSVGLPLPNMDIKVISLDSGKVCPTNEPGEMYVRSPQLSIGYYDNKLATDAMWEDGWLKTGDLVMMDEEGYIYVKDRLKELIKYKGGHVPPAELESVLLKHHLVLDVAVIGVEDDAVGEIPKAFVVTSPDSGLTAEQVLEYAAENIAPYKTIRQVEFVESIPKSRTGKILRRLLKNRQMDKTVNN